MTGWVTGDGDFWGDLTMSIEEYRKMAENKYSGEELDEYLRLFPGTSEAEVLHSRATMGMLSFAAYPSHLLAKYNQEPTYLYEFGHVPPDKENFPNYGAFHTSDVPFSLHTLHKWNRPWREIDYQVEAIMSQYWCNFVKTGNPNSDDLPEWQKNDTINAPVLVVKDEIGSQEVYKKKYFDFLSKN